jgi:hypothetical protein
MTLQEAFNIADEKVRLQQIEIGRLKREVERLRNAYPKLVGFVKKWNEAEWHTYELAKEMTERAEKLLEELGELDVDQINTGS